MDLVNSHRGLTGFSAMIMLVAILLTAITVSSALVYVTNNINNEVTGKERPEDAQFEQPFVVEQVMARDTDNDKRLDSLDFIVHFGKGDTKIKFNDTVIYAGTDVTGCSSFVYEEWTDDLCNYTVTYLHQGSDYAQGYLSPGDFVRIRLRNMTAKEDKNAVFRIVPKSGVLTHVKVDFPLRILGENYQVWPVT